MKKLIALTLMVACLACFSMGCPGKKEEPKPVTPPVEQTTDTGSTTDTTPEASTGTVSE